jgi:hypothetical protein
MDNKNINKSVNGYPTKENPFPAKKAEPCKCGEQRVIMYFEKQGDFLDLIIECKGCKETKRIPKVSVRFVSLAELGNV